MPSAIDPTKPVEGTPTTQSVRDNFAAAKSEIEVLQQTAGQGPQGPQGPSGTLQVGSTTTVEYPGNANVTQGGTPQARVFNFTLPRGPQGLTGPQGTPGVGAGGQGLTSGGALGGALMKRSATNYDAAWLGTVEDLPMVREIVVSEDNARIYLLLDRPAPAGCHVVFWRWSPVKRSSEGSRTGGRRPFKMWRAIAPWGENGSFPFTQITAGQMRVQIPGNGNWRSLYRPAGRLRGSSGWPDKRNNRYLNINTQHPNKCCYRFGTVLLYGSSYYDWQRRSEMSAQTLELMRWVNNPNHAPSLIARVIS